MLHWERRGLSEWDGVSREGGRLSGVPLFDMDTETGQRTRSVHRENEPSRPLRPTSGPVSIKYKNTWHWTVRGSPETSLFQHPGAGAMFLQMAPRHGSHSVNSDSRFCFLLLQISQSAGREARNTATGGFQITRNRRGGKESTKRWGRWVYVSGRNQSQCPRQRVDDRKVRSYIVAG